MQEQKIAWLKSTLCRRLRDLSFLWYTDALKKNQLSNSDRLL